MVDKIDQLKIDSTAYDIDLPADNIVKTNTVYSLMSPSSVSGSSTSGSYKSVRWYVSNKTGEFTAPYDGMKVAVKIPKVGVSTAGVVLSINGNTDANYHPVVYNASTVLTSHYAVNTVKILTYDASATMDCYLTSNTKSTITGVWKAESNYDDGNTDTKVRQYQSGTAARSNTQYPILTRYVTTDKTNSYDTNYSRFNPNTYIDTSNGNIYAPQVYSRGSEVLIEEDCGSAAFKDYLNSAEDGSFNLITSGAVYDECRERPHIYELLPTQTVSQTTINNGLFKLDGTRISTLTAFNTYVTGHYNANSTFASTADEISILNGQDDEYAYLILQGKTRTYIYLVDEERLQRNDIIRVSSATAVDRFLDYYDTDEEVVIFTAIKATKELRPSNSKSTTVSAAGEATFTFSNTPFSSANNKWLGTFTMGNCFFMIPLYGLTQNTTYKCPGTFVYSSVGEVVSTTVNYKITNNNTVVVWSGNSEKPIVSGFGAYLTLIKMY